MRTPGRGRGSWGTQGTSTRAGSEDPGHLQVKGEGRGEGSRSCSQRASETGPEVDEERVVDNTRTATFLIKSFRVVSGGSLRKNRIDLLLLGATET